MWALTIIDMALILMQPILWAWRRGDRARMAHQLGLEYEARRPADAPELKAFGELRASRWRRVSRVGTGMYCGRAVSFFDVTFGLGWWYLRGTQESTFVLVETASIPQPFRLLPKPDGKGYRAVCSDPASLRKCLGMEAVSLLLRADALVIEGNGRALLFRTYRDGLLIERAELMALLDLACDFVDATTERRPAKRAEEGGQHR